jgi:hypothetical protein
MAARWRFREQAFTAGCFAADTAACLAIQTGAAPGLLQGASRALLAFDGERMATLMRLMRVLGAVMSAMLPGAVLAQPAGIDWTDVDCAQSRLWPTTGLHCRTTPTLNRDAVPTGPGHFRFWNAAGTVQDVKYYYYAIEAVDPRSGVTSKQDLSDALRARSPQARGSVSMSNVRRQQGADFVSFVSAAQEPCVGVRKMGPAHAEGASWVLYATRCVLPGQQIAEADIDAFVRDARLRD